ncbi:class IV adenylate cyclase [Streptomyces triticisoli]|jgi:adenylate cyclase class 2|uniref:class IV adenylate cyclase n=1 Tax=Streptomyces triticisoli TaxID=2182797 RepID=UPI000DD57340|nr:class IV adenylate cyclase [Streptomyces triticisoli]
MDGKVIEVERKRRLPGTGGRLTELLMKLGWQAAETVTEVDTYYSRPDVDFMETVECLRVRRRGDFAEVTYKPPSTSATHRADDVISKPETNLLLADAGQAAMADQLLEAVGMRLLVRVEKHRTSFRHQDESEVTVSIDTVADLGVFVETEVLSADPVAAAAVVERVEKELGITDCPTVDLPYRDLAMSVMAPLMPEGC